MSKRKRHGFSASLVQKVAERAGYICSNPSCRKITIGPSVVDPAKSSKIGVAAHICAASSGGPRYDMSQTAAERSGIKNALWLCGNCAALIDKNNGIDYPVDHLRKWKRDHEALMHDCLEGRKRVMLGLVMTSADQKNAKVILRLLDQKGVLFQPFASENPFRVVASLDDLRKELTHLRFELEDGSELDIIAESIIRACRHYMNTAPDHPSLQEMEYSLGAVRKIIGINVGRLLQQYSVSVSPELKSIVPQ